MPISDKEETLDIPGAYIVICLVILTGIVGSMFIYLGPKATEKSPGVLHVGIRYSNENTIDFLRYGKKGPGARIEFIAEDGSIPYSVENLSISRNLVPIKNLTDGAYTVRFSADGFRNIEIPMIAEGRMLNPPMDIEFKSGTYADYNMIGVRLEKIESAETASETIFCILLGFVYGQTENYLDIFQAYACSHGAQPS